MSYTYQVLLEYGDASVLPNSTTTYESVEQANAEANRLWLRTFKRHAEYFCDWFAEPNAGARTYFWPVPCGKDDIVRAWVVRCEMWGL
ncbi:Protein of unknown function [Pyronema omphalodes CBS 100304]|uniref:Uncharacterized protein n=1 Tax=Pyronema omphalodes (strain CBS 100304) TaxID=1076935 RepID=U4L9X9_PYROM|nr:Protein of unknown function [Pyronema omphalodes CBS 100304]